MAWMALTNAITWAEAQAIASPHELACVSTGEKRAKDGSYVIWPIVRRQYIKNRWYNYFDNGRYARSMIAPKEEEPYTYIPYYYVPDVIRYNELLSYIREYLYQFKGKYKSYLLYYTAEKEAVIYSVYLGIIHSPITTPFENPLLYFETGAVLRPHRRPSELRNKKCRENAK